MGGLFTSAIAGLRDGFKELGLNEGKQIVFHVRDGKGDLETIEVASKDLEREGVGVIYSVGSTVTVAVKRATKSVPIVFESGVDPVALHLVESFPAGREAYRHPQSILASATFPLPTCAPSRAGTQRKGRRGRRWPDTDAFTGVHVPRPREWTGTVALSS